MNIVITPDLTLLVLAGLLLALIITNISMRFIKRYKPKFHKRILSWRFRAGITLLVFMFLGMVLVPVMFIKIDSGQVGVLWKRLGGGTYLEKPFDEGTVLVLPWDTLTLYSSRFQTADETIHAITSQGLQISLDVTVRYRPVVSQIPYLHKLVGTDYLKETVLPEVNSAVIMIVSRYTAEQVYGNMRLQVQNELLDEVLKELQLQEQTILQQEKATHSGQVLVNLDDMLIKRVNIPEKVHNAIIAKVNQNYLNEEYDMRLVVARKEAQRKKTEAEGIRDFQQTVSGGISETYLRWRGIEATVELAKSNNSKVVVIGGGKDGLPLILNTETTQGSVGPSPVIPSTTAEKTLTNDPALPFVQTPSSPEKTFYQ
ncbi:MAG: prohibitin 1 [Pseudoalteromonas rhizosphaerae]|jgi:prohibitin 1|uniref:Prohibitin family protein n=1 Tax=Pseudoalteromonas neustonica TaxID=1840331 RepID=A0ABY3FIR5_9GAMM|nr:MULTISPECIES: prohibitin family protein [Pseudoalteromonas]MBB1291651.1 prohibitin family protein [Pseudoalteromonas sp. SR41-4]MBB1309939.1 prohibitin family protein [Pseudoalteromonas sp. SR41-8]MBB1396653.1 prohibitin family protein [Pseudoalteromonas sp. SG44-8]MBB1407820.1 prohibitin family protein [Pseudoalteromonas sp. SG44-17]MBB1504164.1 prohibitin family protein [Pseudoalteromonas sp. SG41-1]|tara:strand:- start:25192 stop:26304 length:1113 start_codon:yes stop_codon:yes gene_type:complete